MELTSKINCVATLSATVHRKDGRKEALGVISTKDGRPLHWFKRAVKYFGFATAAYLAIKLGHGHLPVMFGLVTNGGVNYMASDFASGGVTPTISGFKFHDSGTGTNAAAVTDTALQTATGNARVVGTPTNPSANVYKSVATLAYTGTAAITEWGLFSASTTGTLWDRRVFSSIAVSSGDSISFSYALTISSGGT